MTWIVEFHDEFEPKFLAFDQPVQGVLFAAAKLLAEYGLSLVGHPPSPHQGASGTDQANITSCGICLSEQTMGQENGFRLTLLTFEPDSDDPDDDEDVGRTWRPPQFGRR